MGTDASKDTKGAEDGEIVGSRPDRRRTRRFKSIPNPLTIASPVDWYMEQLVIENGYAHRRSGITIVEGSLYAAGNTTCGSESVV